MALCQVHCAVRSEAPFIESIACSGKSMSTMLHLQRCIRIAAPFHEIISMIYHTISTNHDYSVSSQKIISDQNHIISSWALQPSLAVLPTCSIRPHKAPIEKESVSQAPCPQAPGHAGKQHMVLHILLTHKSNEVARPGAE